MGQSGDEDGHAGATLATRNVERFEGLGALLVNLWVDFYADSLATEERFRPGRAWEEDPLFYRL
jgi:hypothetical protein